MMPSDRYHQAKLTFVALDFETADECPESACALGLVTVTRGEIAGMSRWNIRPGIGHEFRFAPLHGIDDAVVADAPDARETARAVALALGPAEFVAAHHARFDARVLESLGQRQGVGFPRRAFVCTARLFRLAFHRSRTDLPTCARHLDIALSHHDPISDAAASARIVLEAARMRVGRRALAGLIATAKVWS
jgi:DNA polymerase III subunit epsilon